MDEILTVAEVAAYLKISRSTVRRWCVGKKVPAFKIGREWRIDKKELDRVIQRLSQAHPEAPGDRELPGRSSVRPVPN